jgi:hypothetical protein
MSKESIMFMHDGREAGNWVLKASFPNPKTNEPGAKSSTTADVILNDEVHLCHPETVLGIGSRLDWSDIKTRISAYNPRLKNDFADTLWDSGSQEHWHVRCSSCRKFLAPDWFKHFLNEETQAPYDPDWEPGTDFRPICHRCNSPFDRLAPGLYVPKFEERELKSLHISKLFGPKSRTKDLLENYMKGHFDPILMQQFYNDDLGITLDLPGSSLSRSEILACVNEDYPAMDGLGPAVRGAYAGIDVNKRRMAYWIEIETRDRYRVLAAGIARTSDDALAVLDRYNVGVFVMDEQPESELVAKIKQKRPRAWSMRYDRLTELRFLDRSWHINEDKNPRLINANRTHEMDKVQQAIRNRHYEFPREFERFGHSNPKHDDNVIKELMAPVRKNDLDRKITVWDEGSDHDDLYHAAVYARAAHELQLRGK